MHDIVYNILVKYYARLYGYDTCEYMTDRICERLNSGEFKTTADIRNYVWIQTSGGGVAEEVAESIRLALPTVVTDSKYTTR